jgi:dipeptidyl aminopeptidase/acylaminoacyl peptidase
MIAPRTRSATVALLAALLVPALVWADDLEAHVARMAKIGACWSPTFSPDGATVAFVSDLNGVPQVWTVSSEGGWPRLVTTHDDQVGSVTWSPDGKWLAHSVAPGGGMNQQVYLVRPDGSEQRRLTDGGKDNNWLGGWSDAGDRLRIASSRRRPEAVDAWVYDMTVDELTLIAENPGIGYATGLSRDGLRAALWRMESRSSSNVIVRDLRSGEEHVLTPHEGPGNSGGGVFSPDGRTIWLTTDQGRDRVAFGRVELGVDGTPAAIEVLAARDDADAGGFAVTRDGKTAALLWNASGRNELELIDLGNMKRRPVTELPAEILGELTFSRDGRLLAMTASGATRPSDIWVLEVKTRRLRQVTHAPHAGIDLESLVTPELVTYAAHDGLQLSGWLYRPRGAEGRAPYVLSFHGGPEGQERPRFRSDCQALLARGIGVFAPNVRGSAGFGKRFVNLDNGALRYDGIRDIESTVKYLVEYEIADAKRIGIMGGSYGGYMTMAGLAWYPGLFAAGANLFGVVNFETFFAQTEPWMAAISTIEYGDPETQGDLLRDLSPIHRVDRVTAPTIVLHGANDTNVPVVEAEQVVDSLKSRDVPVEYVLFPDEGHGFRKTKNRITATVSIVRWFEKHL